jgi:hypothetical protein
MLADHTSVANDSIADFLSVFIAITMRKMPR